MMDRTAIVLAVGCLLGAAAKAPPVLVVQVVDLGPLAAAPAQPAKPAPVHAALDTAPMPNLDLEAPHSATRLVGAQVTPALFSQKSVFAGNGYANGSSQEQSAEDRRQPAAGLNLSVPVK